MKRELQFPKNGYVDAAINVGHKLVFVTNYFGKDYAMMLDPAGTHYLVPRPFEV